MQAAPARRPYGVLPPDGTDAARRVGMEVRLRTVHTRHRYPVWRNSSRGGVSDTRFPYGGLPPEGTESCLRTVYGGPCGEIFPVSLYWSPRIYNSVSKSRKYSKCPRNFYCNARKISALPENVECAPEILNTSPKKFNSARIN